jgi:hypothetical protein
MDNSVNKESLNPSLLVNGGLKKAISYNKKSTNKQKGIIKWENIVIKLI